MSALERIKKIRYQRPVSWLDATDAQSVKNTDTAEEKGYLLSAHSHGWRNVGVWEELREKAHYQLTVRPVGFFGVTAQKIVNRFLDLFGYQLSF